MKIAAINKQPKQWYNVNEVPTPSKDGVKADLFLVIPLDSDVPKTMYYFYEEKYWTEGGATLRKYVIGCRLIGCG